ncbi:MAG: prepilin-type N-terminal cleavage/methylation domain-containing protein [Comamonadaceae bacterium]
MLTSEPCPRPSSLGAAVAQHGPTQALRGFTLIEVLVVLVLVGLMAGVALPRLFAIAQRFELASQRDALLGEIDALGYRAYVSGKPITLGEPAMATALATVSPIVVPAGWRLEVAQPIQYGFNGICGGGTLSLMSPDGGRQQYVLAPPRCKPVPARGSP